MIFGLFRWIKRKLGFVLLLLALTVAVKRAYPTAAERVGGWISGMEDSRVSQAFSSMISSLTEGEGLRDAVEVFREAMQP